MMLRLSQAIRIAALALAIIVPSQMAHAHPDRVEIEILERIIERSDGGSSHVRIYNPTEETKGFVALIPSLGRGVEDFTEEYGSSLTTSLTEREYTVLLIQPRGIGQSTGDLDPAETDMELFANDLIEVFDNLGIERVSLVGHAFGNRLSRYLAAMHPERVDRLILLAAGGDFTLSAEQVRCLTNSFNLALPEDDRREAIACAFFAKGNEAGIWQGGWYPKLAAAQISAAQSVESSEFKRAGGLPFLIVQPAEDFIAPPDLAGRALAEELGDQVEYVEIDGAGHALLPEKPAQVDEVVAQYLETGSVQKH